MKPSQFEKLLKEKVLAGESHQSVYEHFAPQAKGREKDIADMLANMPSAAKRRDFKVHHWALLSLLLAGIIMEFAVRIPNLFIMGALFVCVVTAWGVWNWQAFYYRYLGIVLAVSLFFVGRGSDFMHIIELFAMFPLAGTMLLAFFLGEKLRHKFKLSYEQVTDAKGQMRTLYKARFLE